jgi:hypothetical protein
MAGRTLNRRDLRRQAEAAEQIEETAAPSADAAATDGAAAKKPRKAPAARKPTVRKPRAPKAQPRLRARWCIYDGAMKPVALFAFNQRAEADAKLADLLVRAKGVHFLRLFKDAIPLPAEGAAE